MRQQTLASCWYFAGDNDRAKRSFAGQWSPLFGEVRTFLDRCSQLPPVLIIDKPGAHTNGTAGGVIRCAITDPGAFASEVDRLQDAYDIECIVYIAGPGGEGISLEEAETLIRVGEVAQIIFDAATVWTRERTETIGRLCARGIGIEHMAFMAHDWHWHLPSLTLAGRRGSDPTRPRDIGGMFDLDEPHVPGASLNTDIVDGQGKPMPLAKLSCLTAPCYVRDDGANLENIERRTQAGWRLGLSPVIPLSLWVEQGWSTGPLVANGAAPATT